MSQKNSKNGPGGVKGTPKAKKAAAGGKKAEDEREERLQAVVLADSFETRFSPFTLETPRCLLPVANTPLIEYTLEFLAMSGVADIFLFCGAHTDEVERYIQNSKWHTPVKQTSLTSPFRSLKVMKTTARSVGDTLRGLDELDLITGDFLLVYGDLVSNLPIDAALAAHRTRRIADKNAIMTMILRTAGLRPHRTKSNGITPVFVVDPTKNRCLHYEEMHLLQANKYVNVDPEILSKHTEIEIRTDLIDCGIDICTPDVLALWSESFDYEVPRRHFLHGVLKDYDLNGKTIHTEIVDEHYAARVDNLQSYDAISKDILGRWTYPLVPDSNLVAGQTYKLGRGGMCRESGVVLARTCKVGKRTVLGKNTSIGDESVVSNSIIGRRCQIGKNVTIQNAYIWDDVTVGDGTTIDRAIVANEVVIGKRCKIQPGSLISYGVRIADSKEIRQGSRITHAAAGDPPVVKPTDVSIVGDGGEGYLFSAEDDSDDEGTAFHSSLIFSTSHLNLSNDSISTINSHFSSATPTQPRSRLSSFAGSTSDDGDPSSTNESFHHDAVNGLVDALKEGADFDSAKLEFTGLRLSNDASDHQMRRAIAVAFTKRIAQLVEGGTEASKAARKAFTTPGVKQFLKEVAVGKDNLEADQVDFLSCLQKDLVHRSSGAIILAAICKELYELEVIEEEAIFGWWDESEALGDSEDREMKRVREKTAVLVQWFRDAEEESSSEEGEESE